MARVLHLGRRKATFAEEGRVERKQAGFSLIELIIAMVVTMIVTGAIYQLLTAGETAFKREPEMADRQQNARIAMDIISQDIFGAGNGIPLYLPVFTPGLDGVGPLGSGGANADEIEIMSTADCGALQMCRPTSNGTSVVAWNPVGACFDLPAPILLACSSGTGCPRAEVFWGENPGGGGGGGGGQTSSCPGSSPGGGENGHIVLPASHPMNPPGGPNFDAQYAMVARIIRYRIRMDGVAPAQVPILERSTRGDTVAANWAVIARGIEDLQFQYLVGGAWQDGAPPAPTPNDPNTIVGRVRVQLSSRAMDGANLVGQTTSAVGDAIRGQLVSEIAPRPAVTTAAIAAREM